MTSDPWLDGASVSPDVFALRPDYHAVLVTARGLTGGPSDEASEHLLSEAEVQATSLIGEGPVEAVPHLAAWREAFRAFGAKPQRTRNSAEALMRRVGDFPRINRLADAYNAVSISLAVPLGGEDLAGYSGPLQLVRATGEEDFEILSSGEPTVEHPSPGEVVWRDDAGVTCRRWNWRQCARTALTEATTDAVFICDVLEVAPGDAASRAQTVLDALTEALHTASPEATLVSRVLSAGQPR